METYNGHVRTPADAIILFEACRIGLLPRVQRRLSEKERQSIKSGSVFVWDEREAGMRRWTDGKSWSASRVSGSFLTYREMEGKRGGSTDVAKPPQATNDQDSDGGPDGYRYKPDGLMKQSFSITTNNSQHLHLISYYSRSSQQSQHLMQPTNDPQLRHIRPEKGMYPESTVHEQSTIPAVTRGPMGSPGYTHAAHQQPPMYGRPGYGYPPHPGAWAPPSPMHTPPPHPHYGPYYQHPGHPGYGHPMGYPPHPAYGPAGYDRPPPHMAGHLPPPPHYGHGPPPSAMQAPGYPPGYPAYPGYAGYPPPPASAAAYPPSTAAPSLPASAPPAPKVDARPVPPPVVIPEPKKDERQDSHQSQGQLKSPARSTPEAQTQSGAQSTSSTAESASGAASAATPAASSGQTIPSIHAMLNAGENGQPPVRSSSRSPGGSRQASDIPMHKLGFEASRDVQALRNLDKTTFKAY